MARRLIGLDVGTNAVTVAEVQPGDPPTLRAFGQVALPDGAMREGEVVDDAALTAAIRRLRDEVGLRKAGVRVGLASPRVLVRLVELPAMSEAELRSALEFQAPELIPIPVEEAVLDFEILERVANDDGEATMRVLLAAAQVESVNRIVAAVEAGGMPVDAIELVPLALVRALAGTGVPAAAGPEGERLAEGIVSFGAGTTVVAVHERGLPRFVRVIGSGGRLLTASIEAGLDLPYETAESLKRQIGVVDDDVVVRAAAAMDGPLASLLDEVRGSLDFYRNQPGAAPLARVQVTGGGAQLPDLPARLAALLATPVELAQPRTRLAIGDIGFADAELPRLDPFLPAPVGVALGGVGGGAVIDLLVRRRRAPGAVDRRRLVAALVAGGLALAALLAIPTVLKQREIDDVKSEAAAQEERNAELTAQIAALGDAQATQAAVLQAEAAIASVLTGDVSWSRMLQEIARTIPNDVWLTAFQGQVDPPSATPVAPPADAGGTGDTTTTAPAAAPTPVPATLSGTVSFTAVGLEFPSVSEWLQRIAQIPSFSGLWVPSATQASAGEGAREIVNFTSDANLTPSARSARLEQLQGGGQ